MRRALTGVQHVDGLGDALPAGQPGPGQNRAGALVQRAASLVGLQREDIAGISGHRKTQLTQGGDGGFGQHAKVNQRSAGLTADLGLRGQCGTVIGQQAEGGGRHHQRRDRRQGKAENRDPRGFDVARFGNWTSPGYTVPKVIENYQMRFSVSYPNEERPAARPFRTTPMYQVFDQMNAVWGAQYGLEVVNYHALPGEPRRSAAGRSRPCRRVPGWSPSSRLRLAHAGLATIVVAATVTETTTAARARARRFLLMTRS